MLNKIKEHLLRLDPSGQTMVTDKDVDRVSIWCDGFEDQPVTINAREVLDVLEALPTGVEVAEGEDGSLWETLHTLDAEGLRAALDYVREHHG